MMTHGRCNGNSELVKRAGGCGLENKRLHGQSVSGGNIKQHKPDDGVEEAGGRTTVEHGAKRAFSKQIVKTIVNK